MLWNFYETDSSSNREMFVERGIDTNHSAGLDKQEEDNKYWTFIKENPIASLMIFLFFLSIPLMIMTLILI